jgi:hypothetical protein
MTNESTQNQGIDQPTHFVVEVQGAAGVHYVICEQVVSAEAGHASLPGSVLADLLNRNPLRAAAIPSDSAGAKPVWLAAAMVGQSGTGP